MLSYLKSKVYIKLAVIMLFLSLFSGCSLLKTALKAVTPTVSTVPQSTEKATKTIRCKGDIKVDPKGDIVCSRGFYLSESSNVVQERKLTLKERILQYISKFFIWFVALEILLFFVFPTLFILFNSKLKTALTQTVSAIQKARKQNADLNTVLSSEQDQNTKLLIQKLKNNNNIK